MSNFRVGFEWVFSFTKFTYPRTKQKKVLGYSSVHRQSSLNRPLVEAHDVLEQHHGLVGLGQEWDFAVRIVDGPLEDGVVRPHLREGDIELGPVVQRGHLKMVR